MATKKKETQVISFDAIKATAEAALAIAKAVKVTDADSAAVATGKRNELKAIGERVENIRKDMVKPIDEARARVQAMAKAIAEPIEAGKKGIEREIMSWQENERVKAEEAAERERIEAEARLAETMADDNAMIEDVERVEAHVEVASAPVKMSKSLAPLKTRETWKFEVTDEKAIPREYLMPDMVKIGQAVRRAENPVRELAGINIFSEVGVG